MSDILSIIVRGILWAGFNILKLIHLIFFDGKTGLDHFIFYKPPPNPWFKG